MPPTLHTARACSAVAVLLLGCAGYAATYHPLLSLPGLLGVAVFACCAADARAEYQRRIIRARRAERLARPRPAGPLAAPAPCCAFWRASGTLAHGPECTRSAASHRFAVHDCCERWWTSLGDLHDVACRQGAGASAADRQSDAPS
ncbi:MULTISPECIES: hypothetical protein [Streptomyces]|uniref:hypothetical protein n=1 Tax=Streptomyces TaxID=1883 RepID=UPI001CE28DF5|nr:hypothetical protein [Streptomyces solaniscabiei]